MSNAAAWIFGSGSSGPVTKPTRDQICGLKNQFQGLTVQTQQYGMLPLFDPVIGWFSGSTAQADRQACYAVHRAVGDTAVNITISGQYNEAGQAYQNVAGRDYSTDLSALHALCQEIINNGFYVLLMMAGDGESVSDDPQSGQYNDPGGMTYGRAWLMRHFAEIHAALSDLSPWIVFCPGYDGVVPGWQPPSGVDAFVTMARGVIGDSGYLALELSSGYCVWAGAEANNWVTPAGQCVDLILQECPVPMGPPAPPPPDFMTLPANERAPWDQIWQIVGRMVQPYNRPSEQPAGDDPNPPFLLNLGTPRGPYFYNVWEICTYSWVRNAISLSIVNQQRAYLTGLGCEHIG